MNSSSRRAPHRRFSVRAVVAALLIIMLVCTTNTTTMCRAFRTGVIALRHHRRHHHHHCRQCSVHVPARNMWVPPLFLIAFLRQRRMQCSSSSSSSSTNPHVSLAASDDNDHGIFDTSKTFADLGLQSPILLQRLQAMQLSHPTHVQVTVHAAMVAGHHHNDVLVGAATGTGKTLAYLLPLLDNVLMQKARQARDNTMIPAYDYARAIILVPNQELTMQVLRMAAPLAGGAAAIVYGGGGAPRAAAITDQSILALHTDTDIGLPAPPQHEQVRLAVLPGGLQSPTDFAPFRHTAALGGATQDPPLDIIITTPAALGPLALSPANIDFFADVATLVIDEADMLLDGGYLRQLENVLLGFRRADKLSRPHSTTSTTTTTTQAAPADNLFATLRPTQHVWVAATLPNAGTRSVQAYLQRHFPHATRVLLPNLHVARHPGLHHTTWIELDSKKARLQELVRRLQLPAATDPDSLALHKVMVFCNSVDNVNGASQALQRAGIDARPYHAKLARDERIATLEQFRAAGAAAHPASDHQTGPPVLVCTDLAARGLDLPHVSVVVQLQFAGNVVAHLHRMGRCGRPVPAAASLSASPLCDSRGIIFYSAAERDLVQVVQQAERAQQELVLHQDVMEADYLEDDIMDPVASSSAPTVAAPAAAGSVQAAFSRKRGFTKKRKKLQRLQRGGGGDGDV